ncbi:MAG TPA: Calx-beta domain-containing protein, partial [Thermoanaerobaculia bacterium]|nr:Calx-beta domain-containing protein [Thermoanaerobaculia bacterium]
VYTLDGDFDLGFAAGVNHDAPNGDRLQLDAQGGTFPFLWVAASGRGTIVKIDTRSGKVLGEISTSPDDRGNSDPSRTTVAFDGSVWVGNRGDGSVTHVGLAELGQCIDRNNNGAIETSSAYGNVLPWPNPQGVNTNGGVSAAADECLLHYVKIRQGNFLPRHVSVDREGRIWVGAYGTCTSCFDQLDGTTGALLRQVNLPCGGYGGFIDGNGVLWSSTNGNLLRWDPATAPSTAQCISAPGTYGVAIGRDGNVYVNNHGANEITKVAPNGTILFSFKRGSTCGQGLAVDDDEHIWSSSSRWCEGTQISHVKGDGTSVGTLDNVPTGTTGISVDDTGKIWAVADQGNKAFRIDPDQGPIGADGVSHVGAIDLVVEIPGAFAYNYSDMTGFQALRHTLRQGSWSTTQDAGFAGAEWGVVSWNSEPQAALPPGSSIVVEVRTAETVVGLGTQTWLVVNSGQEFQRFGRYLQVRATLRKGTATTGPVLSDLRIGIQEPDVRVADATVTEGDAGDVSATFAVTLSEAVGHPVVIGYRTVAGSATADVDYRTRTGSITIPAGALAGSIVVPVVGDTDDEDDETFTVELTSAQGGRIADGVAEGRILDDDTRLVVTAAKTAELADDRDGNGSVTPGDRLAYTVVIRNVGAAALGSLVFEDSAPAGTQVVAGSVTTDAGTVQSESPVQVAIPSLAVDAAATVRFRVSIGVPWSSGPAVVNQGRVTGLPNGPVLTDDPALPGAEDPTVTPLAAVPVLAASKTDALATDADLDGHASPGDTLRYQIVVTNTGITAATQVVVVDAAPPHTALVGSPETSQGSVVGTSPVRVELGTLAADTSATVTFTVRIDSPLPTGVTEIVNQATVNSVELPAMFSGDPDVPGNQDPTVTPVTAAPRLLFTKVDELAVDADLDTRPSPGDTIAYTVRVRNDGNTAATAVVIHDATPPNTTLVAGSVSLSAGTLSGVDPIVAQVGELAVGDEVVLTFRVRIVSPVEPWVREVVNQATVSCAELDDLRSDDPDVPGVANPTATAVAAAPVLMLSKTDALHTDPNDDGYASPGEVVQYQLTLTNTGNTAATAVVLTDPLPHFATLEAGSLQTSLGTATEGDPLQVAIDSLPVDGTVTVSFRVRIADPFPADETELVNHASVAATELAAVPSDDPATAAPRDATRTPVIRLVDVNVADLTVGESAGTASFVVTLSEASRVPVTVSYTVAAGSATAGADFTAVADTLTIPAGQTQGTIAVPVLDDTLDEADETFTLTLADPVGALLADATAVATIVDDDAPPSLSLADVSVTEGDSGTTAATFTLTLSAPSALAIAVDYATATGTAGTADFTAASGTVSFAPGELSRTVTVNVLGDLLDEEDEAFTLALANPQQVVLASTAATGTIVDDDAPPAISIGDVSVDEGNSGAVEARFTVTLSAASGREVRVAYTTAGLEATAGADFQATPGELAIAAGTTSATVVVPVLGDLLDEPDEHFELRLSQPVDATLSDGIGTGTIRDDDAPPQLTVGDVSVHEGDSGFTNIDVPLRLSAASGFVVTVAYATADGTASSPADYLPAADAAMIPAGVTEQMVTLKVRGDLVDELDEIFELHLSNVANAMLADATGQVTIVDDDAPVQVSVGDATVIEGHSGTKPATFTVSLSQPSALEVRVHYATAAGTATAGSDFVAAAGDLVFAPGTTSKTVDVQVNGDVVLEPDETFEVRLSQPVNGDLGDAVGVGTIVDDEACPGPNLLANPGAELSSGVGTVPGWTAVTGTQWQTRATDPLPAEGNAYFFPGSTQYAELVQDVDVSAYASRIAAGTQYFSFEGRLRTRDEQPSDAARIVVEYRDAANAVVLGAFDSGDLVSPTEWRAVTDIRTAPVGTAKVRVRLLATRFAGTPDDGYFDALVLRSLRAPVLTIDDVAVDEGDTGTTNANFTVHLSCPVPSDVSVGYQTANGTAQAGQDYTALAAATLVLPAGAVTGTIPVPVIGDVVPEPDETFSVQLSNPVGAVLLDPTGIGTIRENVSCAAASTIDYKGYTAASCAVPQNAVTVHDQTELNAYLANFGWDGSKVRNVIVNFNPAGQVTIVSPCEIRMKGTGTGGYLDINAEKVCLYGRKGVVVAEDHGNPDQGITASAITLVSEEGSAGFSKGLELAADTIDVRALKEAKVGLSCNVTANVLNVVSTGDLTTSEALIRQDSTVHAPSVLVQASRGATIGPSTSMMESCSTVTLLPEVRSIVPAVTCALCETLATLPTAVPVERTT